MFSTLLLLRMLLVSLGMFHLSSSQFLTKICACMLFCTLGRLKLA